MILDLKRIFAAEGSRLTVDTALDMSDVEVYGEYPLKNPVTAKGEIWNKAGVVSLSLLIRYDFTAPCDRCGKATTHEHTVQIDKMLAASLQRQESDTIIEVPGMKFDVDEFVYAEAVLSLPTKHLCRADCKGLCPVCGKDLNDGACNCVADEGDPRLAVLKSLLKN